MQSCERAWLGVLPASGPPRQALSEELVDGRLGWLENTLCRSASNHQLAEGEFDLGWWARDSAGDLVGVVGELAAVLLEDPRWQFRVASEAFQLGAFQVEPALGVEQLQALLDGPVGGFEVPGLASVAGHLQGGLWELDDGPLGDVGCQEYGRPSTGSPRTSSSAAVSSRVRSSAGRSRAMSRWAKARLRCRGVQSRRSPPARWRSSPISPPTPTA